MLAHIKSKLNMGCIYRRFYTFNAPQISYGNVTRANIILVLLRSLKIAPQ